MKMLHLFTVHCFAGFEVDTYISIVDIFVLLCCFVGSDQTLRGSQVRCWPPLVAPKGRWE